MDRFVRVEQGIDGRVNMDRDRALLTDAEDGRAGARVYTWDGPWVSYGRFQNPERETIESGIKRRVIRPTGGKAVIHGDDLTVSIALPLAPLALSSRSVKEAYRLLAGSLVRALRGSGMPAILAEGTRWSERGARTAECFAYNSPNDIVHESTGKKVCGCALRLTERGVLLQASIPNPPGHPIDARAFARHLEQGLAAIYVNWTIPIVLPSKSET